VEAGLPDGIFSNQKYQFGKMGLEMENVGITCGNLVIIWYIFTRFGIIVSR
jgi:hypothetical protein